MRGNFVHLYSMRKIYEEQSTLDDFKAPESFSLIHDYRTNAQRQHLEKKHPHPPVIFIKSLTLTN